MVSLETVRASNANLKALGPGLVAIFVGGTSGIGETTAREFVRNTVSPKVYLVGRDEEAATRIKGEFETINPESKISFIKSDISLLANVDKTCAEIKALEPKINLLFMSAGFLSMSGRDETSEGLDKKLNLNYYSRFRFSHYLLPQLDAAAKAGGLSRQVSVLAAGHEDHLVLDDLALKKSYSMKRCAGHATTMNSLMTTYLAAAHPDTTFVHIAPGFVKSNAMRDLGLPKIVTSAILLAFTPAATSLPETGERQLYAATSPVFAPKSQKSENPAIGADGQRGGGAYLLNWNDEPAANQKILEPYRAQGVAETVYKHTLDVFRKVCDEGKPW